MVGVGRDADDVGARIALGSEALAEDIFVWPQHRSHRLVDNRDGRTTVAIGSGECTASDDARADRSEVVSRDHVDERAAIGQLRRQRASWDVDRLRHAD
jgi:hypothetical protein